MRSLSSRKKTDLPRRGGRRRLMGVLGGRPVPRIGSLSRRHSGSTCSGHRDAHRVPLLQAPAGTSGRTRVTAALCRAIDFQERLLQMAAFAQNPSSYTVGDGDEIHGDERAYLAFLDEPLRAITVIPSPLPKFHQERLHPPSAAMRSRGWRIHVDDRRVPPLPSRVPCKANRGARRPHDALRHRRTLRTHDRRTPQTNVLA
jgi:hypothetical protein